MATITEAREEFRRISGRQDLTTLQVDEYLNKGQQFLDQATEYQKAPTRLQGSVTAGGLSVTFTARMRTIFDVWITQTGQNKSQLGKLTDVQYREMFPGPPSSLTRGLPQYYTPDPLTYYNASGEFQFYNGAYADSFASSGILIGPPADGAYQIEVLGRFYSPQIGDAQSSWWLQQQSTVLVLAAMRMLEGHYRNTQGMKDWENAIGPLLKAVHDDYAEEESMNINRMEG